MLMMENNFIAGSAHIDNLDEKAQGLPIVLESKENSLTELCPIALVLAAQMPSYYGALPRLINFSAK